MNKISLKLAASYLFKKNKILYPERKNTQLQAEMLARLSKVLANKYQHNYFNDDEEIGIINKECNELLIPRRIRMFLDATMQVFGWYDSGVLASFKETMEKYN